MLRCGCWGSGGYPAPYRSERLRLRKFEDHLREKLQDPEYAAAYLEAAAEDGTEELQFALGDVVPVQDDGSQDTPNRPGVGS